MGDTIVGPASWEIALLSLGGVLVACDEVMQGRARRAFVAGRPPGHHAEPDRAMGFCLLSNVAIGARYLQQKYGVERVAIVDFDVHHGNGTQAVFEADPTVFFVSLHQHPRTCYPGSGFEWEKGVREGIGYTMNLPMRPGTEDDAYVEAIEQRVLPALEAFAPEVLMISAGFDAHHDDPLAKMSLSEEGFERTTRTLVGFADRHCDGRVISVLEGGYDLRALGRSVVRHLIALGEKSE
jgi:acetoin utilization deacetylase AcuC-like enzyme